MARKPEKKKEVQTSRHELTVGLGKRKVMGRIRTIAYKNVFVFEVKSEGEKFQRTNNYDYLIFVLKMR